MSFDWCSQNALQFFMTFILIVTIVEIHTLILEVCFIKKSKTVSVE